MGIEYVFKNVDEYTINTFQVYKNWATGDFSASVSPATQSTDPAFRNTLSYTPANTLWDSIHHLFYDTGSGLYNTFAPYTVTQSLTSSAVVISIDNAYIGEGIRPGSITMESASILVTDDAVGNLYDGTTLVGNAFYPLGIIVVTNTSSIYQSMPNDKSNFVMNYKSTVTINENNVLLNIVPSEFNMTCNPTAATLELIDSSSALYDYPYQDFIASESFSPYITTIGLYDDKFNLVAVAKFAKPLKKSTDIPMSIAIRWDM